ncbi:MAG: AAA family ATPase [Candidatus Methanomethylicota archaeon]|uniref:AAA family ATPase n=1 Tax=Thermoproteota archaeon TaxID=2056631 RepID=A0A497EM83_9CREN|nr:MAG: AAA family ATPase [Candidatus Verstraetearchaeota archaeon]
MITRNIQAKIQSYWKQYPVVTITGPRQSGKTTLCKMLFPKQPYFSLEDIDIRNYARNDPRAFLEKHLEKGVVLDEIQRVPELTSYIQTIVDEKAKEGLFVLTGSQNFELLNTIGQTLAGRTALATLLPFSFDEIYKTTSPSLDIVMQKGFYPRIHDKKLNPQEALSFYVSTYLERDIRSLINIKGLSRFETFLKLCASRTGQVLNLSSLANDCGINHNTAKSWLNVLEASYVIFLVRPHYKNFRKRLVKSPKLYFIDTGLAAYLLDIENPKQLASHPLKGALFETFVVTEILKQRLNAGKRSNLYYFRDNVGNEVDLILDYGTEVIPVEIKLGKTINRDFLKGLRYYYKLNSKSKKGYLIYGGNENQLRSDVNISSYQNISGIKEF